MPIRPGRDLSMDKISSAMIATLVASSILCTLIVPIYASTTPRVGDWPFFYFYLLAAIPFVAITLCVTAMLQRRLKPAERAEAGE